MNKKITFLIVLIIILLLAGVAVALIINRQDRGDEVLDDFNDWLSYKNEEYGFKINYPQDWQIEEREESLNNISFLISKKEDLRGGHKSYIQIIPTGRIFGAAYGNFEKRNTVFLGREAEELIYFTIENDFWGKIISISSNVPDNWGEDNMIIFNIGIDDLELICEDYYPDGSCIESGFMGYSGLIDKEEEKILEDILSTFEFIK